MGFGSGITSYSWSILYAMTSCFRLVAIQKDENSSHSLEMIGTRHEDQQDYTMTGLKSDGEAMGTPAVSSAEHTDRLQQNTHEQRKPPCCTESTANGDTPPRSVSSINHDDHSAICDKQQSGGDTRRPVTPPQQVQHSANRLEQHKQERWSVLSELPTGASTPRRR
ncbi:hypothetical protein MN608_05886 [Microdochium nivale]|nr:hypothetical protein MN608_05886 [Microdochium nivale]